MCMFWVACLITLVLVILLIACCKIESKIQYSAKMLLFYIFVALLATITLPVGLFRPFNPSNHQVLAFMVPYIVKHLFGVTVEVRNIEHTYSKTPFVLLLNHQSSIDAFVMMHIWPERTATLMKKELLYIPPFGLTAWLFGSIFINRTNRSSAQSTMKAAATELKNRNVKICMFPEGTRNRDGHMLPFKKGAFNLAIEAQVPLVPAVISSYRSFYSKKDQRFCDGKIIIKVLPPVSVEGKTLSDVPDIADSIREQMVDVYEQISAEIEPKKLS